MENNTYLTIDSNEICQQAEGILNKMGVGFSLQTSRKVGSLHQVVYNLDSLRIDSMEDQGLLPRIIFLNSYNKESAFVIGVGLLRGICQNGLVFGQSFFNEKIIHRVGPTAEEKLDALQTKIDNAIHCVSDMTDHIDEMKGIEFSAQSFVDVVGNLNIPSRVKDFAIYNKLTDRLRPEDSVNNAWCLYNVVNESLRKHGTQIQYTTANRKLMDDVICLTEDVKLAA